MIDLVDPGLFARGEQHAAFRQLRRETPIFWHPLRGGGFWAILRHRDVVAVARDPATFTSSRGTGVRTGRQAAELQLNESDAPVHAQLRRLVGVDFTPRQIGTLEPYVRTVVRRSLADLRKRRFCDFAEDFAAPLAFAVLAKLVGIPSSDWATVAAATRCLNGVEDPAFRGPDETAVVAYERAASELARYLDSFILRVRDGVGARIAALEGTSIGDYQISRDDVAALLRLVLEAGHETTSNAIAAGVLALAEHPKELARLRANVELVPLAVEEIIRFTSPIIRFGRRVTQDVELAGTLLRAGDQVVMFFASANRDEDVFVDPDRFDVGRTPNDHVGFGAGPHFCLGAPLARLQLRVVLEELLASSVELRVAGPVIRLGSTLNSGLRHFPLSLQ